MRTPGQFQQNYPRELAINEAAALAGIDAIEFRIQNATEDRVDQRTEGGARRLGMGHPSVSHSALRPPDLLQCADAAFHSCSARNLLGVRMPIAVTPSTGAIMVEKATMAVDPGIVINPLQLKRQVEGGMVMGVSIALLEEVLFDERGVTRATGIPIRF